MSKLFSDFEQDYISASMVFNGFAKKAPLFDMAMDYAAGFGAAFGLIKMATMTGSPLMAYAAIGVSVSTLLTGGRFPGSFAKNAASGAYAGAKLLKNSIAPGSSN